MTRRAALSLAFVACLVIGLTSGVPLSSATSAAGTAPVSTGAAGWGYDDDNEATGSGNVLAFPRRVARGAMPADAQITQLSKSWGGHYCAIAGGAPYCWGPGESGQLGNGQDLSSAIPVAVDMSGVLAGKSVVRVAAERDATCALTADSLIACWGSNAIGQLGTGATGGVQLTPGLVDQSGALSGKTIVDLAPGQSSFCALDSLGQAYCWGWDNEGQLGIGGLGDQSVPTAVDQSALNGEKFTSITGARLFYCGVTDAHRVYCWGYNRYGEIGDGSNTSRSTPTPVVANAALSNNAASVVAGQDYACALRLDGEVACWGDNLYRQLGDGGLSGQRSNVPVAFADFPARAGRAITVVAPSEQTTCVLVAGVDTYCLGYGGYGTLGNGEYLDYDVPQPILDVPSGLNGQTLTSFAFVSGAMCGLSAEHDAFCWGYNYYGYSGIGSGSPTMLPTMVSGEFLSAGETFVDIEAGELFSCGLTSLHRMWCWGRNDDGQLGDGTTEASWNGRAVGGGLAGKTIVDMGVGASHVCALVDDGSMWCWGSGRDGELGDGAATPSSVPVQVDFSAALPVGRTIASVSAGQYATCALDDMGSAYCWGNNNYGQLGVGDTALRTRPEPVDTSGVLSGKSLTFLEIDYATTCALDSAGAGYCWGRDQSGSLGNGNPGSDAPSPTVVVMSTLPPGAKFTVIDPGEAQTCGAVDGIAYCWGNNSAGQLGTGDSTDQPLPYPVDTSGALSGKTIVGLAMGYYSSCALDSEGVVYCWGQNDAGQNGTGDVEPTYSPNPIAISGTTIDGMKFTKITASGENSIVQGILAPSNAVPSVPTGVQVAGRANGRALVSWQEPADTGGSAISDYVVQFATSGSGPWSTPAGCASVGAALSCVATGLNVTRNYVFRVSAVNDTGEGPGVRVWLNRTPSVAIAGRRSDKAASAIIVDGTTVGLTSKQVTVRVKLRGQSSYTSYPAGRVDAAGRFAWRGEAVRKAFVVAVVDGVRSPRITIS